MPKFKYRSKGTANDDWHEDEIEADTQSDAVAKLDQVYGIERNEYGEQTNSGMVQVELIKDQGVKS